tara:strand:+ start:1550 stop:1813 length:264 start_codon:yes stop_codon:yes gene_type:complete
MSEERTAEEIATIFTTAGDSVTLINNETEKFSYETEDEWKDRIQRNVQHLETIKGYKLESDGTTSIWTNQDFTAIDAAILKGKAVYE